MKKLRKRIAACFLQGSSLFGLADEFSGRSSWLLSFILFMDSWISGLSPQNVAAFLAAALVRLPCKDVCAAIWGMLTTNDESDLSFLLAGNVTRGKFSRASIFLLFNGNILDLKSCRLWSALQMVPKLGYAWRETYCIRSWKYKARNFRFNQELNSQSQQFQHISIYNTHDILNM